MDNYRVGDKVIVCPYIGYKYKGTITDVDVELFGEKMYQVRKEDSDTGLVNPVKIRLDKEYYREQKLKDLLDVKK